MRIVEISNVSELSHLNNRNLKALRSTRYITGDWNLQNIKEPDWREKGNQYADIQYLIWFKIEKKKQRMN